MTVYLVRHGKAGERNAWKDDDVLRPLSGRGHVQARGLVDVLDGAQFDRVLSSPYVRCMETVVPLAGLRGVAIEPVDALAEGAPLDDSVALVRKHAVNGAVFCTHGDIIPMLLEHYATHGVDVGPSPQWPKGSTWVLETDNTGEVIASRYLPPPPD
ncbi:MAG: 8-oxo-(d)GTP phosphatase [Actinomycetota bacterium]|nr:8-oxo-(d)GTP phosphatase [Actinomycetota bacterium]MDQ1383194.1 8-oxo-(d)GTP phosphatase [Actinomycetota bacterium]